MAVMDEREMMEKTEAADGMLMEKTEAVAGMLAEDERRLAELSEKWNPITGEGSCMERVRVEIVGFPLPVMWVPRAMMDVPLVSSAAKVGVDGVLIGLGQAVTDENRAEVVEKLIRIRCRYDFAFWCRMYVYIKAKGGGGDVRFKLNRPQRKLVAALEEMRLAGKPIRLIILKARQWGGSTCTQIYMAWLQLVHKVGLNSLIVAHLKDTSFDIKDMYDRMLKAYPVRLLHKMGEDYSLTETKMEGVGGSQSIKRVPQRNCKIKVGSAEAPDSARGGDYNLVHCSEVALWKSTDQNTPEKIVRSACSGILLKPYTMIVYESTANGVGNFFHREYDAAKAGRSQFRSLFVAWYEIEQYSQPFASDEAREAFARTLYERREMDTAPSTREATGRYLWWLWETQGATLEAISWYVLERSKYNDDGDMASEYPSDDVEAFVYSGARVFDRYKVEAFRAACKPPVSVGDVVGTGTKGESALRGLRFTADRQGALWVWEEPEKAGISDRYLVVVDIGGRSGKADWSVILVLDRIWMMDGDKPVVVAQWYGHIDMDLLAWKAAQVAAWYDNALLVIESNTLETHERDREVDGDQSGYVLSQIRDVYDNLYARKQSAEEIREGAPRKYGFHTNVKTKPEVISTLVECIRERLYVERDERCLDEYLSYERRQNGSYGAIPGKHDDLLMTRAIGLHICFNEMDLPREERQGAGTVKRKRIISEASI